MQDQSHPLRLWRLERGMTALQVAKAADTTEASISRIENGLQQPRPALLGRIVTATGLSADRFLEFYQHLRSCHAAE